MALTDNLVAFWELENLNDSVGSLTLTNVGSTPFNAAKVGNGADVNGTSQYLSLADNTTIQLGNIDWSFQVWLKFDDLGTTRVVFGKHAGGVTAAVEYALYGDSGLNLKFRIGTGLGFIDAVKTSISTATWYHCICTYDATTHISSLIVNDATAITGDLTGTNPPVSVGLLYFGVDEAGRFHDGLIDQVGIWKRKLSGADITSLYNGGAGLSYAAMAGGAPAGQPTVRRFQHTPHHGLGGSLVTRGGGRVFGKAA